MMRRHPSRQPGLDRSGKTLIMFALMLPLLLGMVGLAIDSGLLLATYRQTQNAADSGALAAAMDLLNGKTTSTAQTTGTTYVQTYNNMSGATVTINIPPSTGPHVGSSAYAEALISYPYKTSFIQLLGVNKNQTVSTRAVAGYHNAQASGVLALLQVPTNGVPAGISVTGGAVLKVNGGVIDNSTDSAAAMTVNNGGSVEGLTVAVSGAVSGSSSVTNYTSGGANPLTQNTGVNYTDPYASLPVPTTSNGVTNTNYGNSSATGGVQTITSSGSTPSAVTVANGNSAALQPGIYQSISIQGGSTVTFAPGIYVLAGGGLNVGNGATVSGSGVMFYNTSATYNPVTGADGSGANTGQLNLNGGVSFNISGMTGGTFSGLLVFQDRANYTTLTLNNGSSSPSTTSTYYAPTANLSITGGATYDSPFVVGSMTLSNGVSVNITPPNTVAPYANLVFLVE
jgi:Flp pilus assembly protein TadG